MVKRRAAFTLVELLVVIGIIALLISILLPSLNKARQFANNVKCASNQRQIGQLFFMYAAQNNGYFPRSSITTTFQDPGPDGQGTNPQTGGGKPTTLRVAFWPDLLTTLANRQYLTQKLGTTGNGTGPYVGYNLTNAGNMALDFLPVFHDTDLSVDSFHPRVSTYYVNPRVIAPTNLRDRAAASGNGQVPGSNPAKYFYMPQRSQGSIKNASDVMMMWCAPIAINTDPGNGPVGAARINQYDSAAWQIDAFALTAPTGSHNLANPFPSHITNLSGEVYEKRIGISSDGTLGGSSCGTPPTLSGLKASNTDFADNSPVNTMRFRHMNNSSVNALFVDGHVESRPLGTVIARDVCVNALKR
jgi:prepilin-type processing-associated H-X9-DG protein/prepilin-type N-terminal cleavage/methylation domain-containing protein